MHRARARARRPFSARQPHVLLLGLEQGVLGSTGGAVRDFALDFLVVAAHHLGTRTQALGHCNIHTGTTVAARVRARGTYWGVFQRWV